MDPSTTMIYFLIQVIPQKNKMQVRSHVYEKMLKNPKAPQGSFPQNVINPKLTRIFLTDVISKPDVKP